MDLVDGLAFEDEPPYEKMQKLLAKASDRTDMDCSTKTKARLWDWDDVVSDGTTRTEVR